MKFLCSSMSFSPMLVHLVLETLHLGSHVWERSRWSLSCHIPEACQTGFALLQVLDELLASCLVGNQALPRPLYERLRLAQLHIDCSCAARLPSEDKLSTLTLLGVLSFQQRQGGLDLVDHLLRCLLDHLGRHAVTHFALTPTTCWCNLSTTCMRWHGGSLRPTPGQCSPGRCG